MNLAQALRVTRSSKVAFVGAGGKTTAMFRLAREVAPVILAVSAHFGVHQAKMADRHLVVESARDVAALRGQPLEDVLLFTGQPASDRKLKGVAPATLAEICRLADHLGCPLLIEADGSRQHPLKAPAAHEPVIPDFVDCVAVMAGMRGLGKRLTSAWVHRPERFAALAGVGMGARIDARSLTAVLTHSEGGLKGIPPGAWRVVLFNQADDAGLQAQARGMADRLLGDFYGVGIAALEQGKVFAMHERVAAVVLAAGKSERLGQPKQLLDWRGRPLVRHVVAAALGAGVSEVVVVTGAFAEGVEAALAGLPVRVVRNPRWAEGQSTSVRAGLGAISPQNGAALFLLVDQPWVSPRLIRALIETHARSLAPIVAPLIDQRRGNPVLFDRATFPAFDGLAGDVGARALFARYRTMWVPWHDSRALMDVDTPEDYQRLIAE